MVENLEEVARSLAKSLSDPEARAELQRRMDESNHPEGKLHFRTLFDSPSFDLSSRMASSGDQSEEGLRALLDRTVDLELYLPGDSHRATWRGGARLLVATVLDDDGSQPKAFALDGSVAPIGRYSLPLTPTLALVPNESAIGQDQGSGYVSKLTASEAGPMRSYSTDGIYMTSSVIPSSFEGPLMGDPEFEVHTFARDAATGEWEDIECAGEARSSPHGYNQDEDYTWSGDVLLATKAQADGEELQFQVWENDSGECTSTSGRPPKMSGTDLGELEDFGSAAVEIYEEWDGGNWVDKLERIVKLIGEGMDAFAAVQHDDMVGIIAWPPVDCWAEASGPVVADIVSEDSGHSIEGSARLDNSYAERTPLCSLSVSMSGPFNITTCPGMLIPTPPADYSSSVSGGSGSIAYQWYLDGEEVGSSSSFYTVPNAELTPGAHMVEVLATRGGEQAMDWMSVNVTAESQC